MYGCMSNEDFFHSKELKEKNILQIYSMYYTKWNISLRDVTVERDTWHGVSVQIYKVCKAKVNWAGHLKMFRVYVKAGPVIPVSADVWIINTKKCYLRHMLCSCTVFKSEKPFLSSS